MGFESKFALTLLLLLCGRTDSFKFSIVHNSDIRGRYDPIDEKNETCTREKDLQGFCYGGFARVATALSEARSQGPTIFLNAGNTFLGTPWYTIYKGDFAAELLNMLQPDAVSLGTHEFDNDLDGLIPFLNRANFPVLCSNIHVQESALKGIKSFMPSVVITKFAMKIGVIGYLTPGTARLLTVNLGLLINNEEPEINKEATRLQEEEGVKIIIALGHSGFEKDKELALNCPDVDIVVGGNSHTFLYTGTPPGKERAVDNYPTIVTRPNGRQVPVVHAYAFAKYLGKLDVEFDSEGQLIKYSGAPILLDDSVAHSSKMRAVLDSRRIAMDSLEKKSIGISKVIMDGNPNVCRQFECNLGNFIADAWVYGRVKENQGGKFWTDAAMAVMNAGGIRSSFKPQPSGEVTEMDVANILPYNDPMSVTRITGLELMQALEFSASLRNTYRDGGFLQVSGMRIVINYNRPKGKRITSINVLCAACKIPKFEPLDRSKFYRVVMPKFVINGGDGQRHFRSSTSPRIDELKSLDRDYLTTYFRDHTIVYPMVDGRIQIIEKRSAACSLSKAHIVPIIAFMCSYNFLLILINF